VPGDDIFRLEFVIGVSRQNKNDGREEKN